MLTRRTRTRVLRRARSNGSTIDAMDRTLPASVRLKGVDAMTDRPSSAAACSSRMSESVSRAVAKTRADRSTSPSRALWAASRTRVAMVRATWAACRRGWRSAARGTIVANTSATPPPTTASSHRPKAADPVGTSTVTAIDRTADCMTSN